MFLKYARFFLAEMEAREKEGGGRVLLGENKAAGRSGSSVLEVGFKLNSFVYT
jgi:hypothetical protein